MQAGKIKLLIWDLDETVWNGTLAERDAVQMKGGVRDIIETLDKRGILQSICSKNDEGAAAGKLKEWGLWDYFIRPKINWDPKWRNIRRLLDELRVAEDAAAFADDQAFERDEAAFHLKGLRCIPAEDIPLILGMDMMNPDFVTEESRLRRKMMQSDIARSHAESRYQGKPGDFLATLGMRLCLRPAREEDLERASELTVRTHQLNSTGLACPLDELRRCIADPSRQLLVAGLSDCYGSDGIVGLALIHDEGDTWLIRLLLTSCRVMSRGIGTVLLRLIQNRASARGKGLVCAYLPNGRNQIMAAALMMNRFQREPGDEHGVQRYRCTQREPLKLPAYIRIDEDNEGNRAGRPR